MTETYMQKLYRTDSTFREKQKKQARAWHNNHKEHVRKREKIRYANRTVKQIEDRKLYLKNRREKQRRRSNKNS